MSPELVYLVAVFAGLFLGWGYWYVLQFETKGIRLWNAASAFLMGTFFILWAAKGILSPQFRPSGDWNWYWIPALVGVLMQIAFNRWHRWLLRHRQFLNRK